MTLTDLLNASRGLSGIAEFLVLFCSQNITTVEIISGVHLLKSYIRQVPLFTSGGLDLGLVSSGLGLGLVTLVLVLGLRIWYCLHHWSVLSINSSAVSCVGAIRIVHRGVEVLPLVVGLLQRQTK